MLRVWERALEEDADELPGVVSVVLYHGDRPWPYGRSLHEALRLPAALMPYAPNLHHELCDLTSLADEAIRGAVMLRAAMLLMKHIADPDLADRLPGILGLWRDLVNEPSALAALAVLLRYIASAGKSVTEHDLRRALSHSLPIVEETLMSTIAEEWIEEGEARGRDHGRTLGRAEFLLHQLERRFGSVPEPYRDRIDRADPDTLFVWGDRLLTAQSLQEVFEDNS